MHPTPLSRAAACLACSVAAQAQETCGSTPATAANHSDNYLLDGDTAMHWATGLVWKRCLEGTSWNNGQCSGTATAKSWTAWADTDRLLPKTFAGQAYWDVNASLSQNLLVSGGWRMAYKNELLSITTDCSDGPKVNRVVFPDTPPDTIWSGSPHAYYYGYYTQFAWMVMPRSSRWHRRRAKCWHRPAAAAAPWRGQCSPPPPSRRTAL